MPPPQIRRPRSTSDADLVITITVDDFETVLRPREVNAMLGLELRRTVGYSVWELVRMLVDSKSPDIVAIAVWLAVRQAGDLTTNYAEIATQIDHGSDITVRFDKVEEGAEGEVPAAGTGGNSPIGTSATA